MKNIAVTPPNSTRIAKASCPLQANEQEAAATNQPNNAATKIAPIIPPAEAP